MLPQDPYILLSVVNTKLRDDCPCLDDFCAREGVDAADLAERAISESGIGIARSKAGSSPAE